MRSHGTALAAGSIQRGRSRLGRFSNCLPAPLIVMAALALSPTSSAVASEPITFAQTGEGAGQINNPRGMAVDQSSGNVYIADENNQRIDEFDASGGFLMAFGFGVRTGAEALETCTAATGCIEGRNAANTRNYNAGALGGPRGIAAGSGQVWVSDNLNRATEFDSSGVVLRIIGGDVVAYGPGDSTVNGVQKVTVKATGGTFKLKLTNPFTGSGTAETTALNYNAPATDPGTPGVIDSVEEALNALSTIGGLGGSVSVSRVENSPTEFVYTITFGGNLGGDLIPKLTTVNNLIGTTHTVTVSVLTAGGAPEVCVPPVNGDVCKMGTAGTANGQLQQPRSPLAVDGSGNLWVGDQNRVQKFAPDGTYLATVALAGHGNTNALAVNSAGTKIYVISAAAAYKTSVRVYDTATGIQLGSPIDDVAGEYKTIALDSSENLFVADRPAGGDAVFREFNPAGEQIEQFGAGQVFGIGGPEGIAVGADALYSNSFSFTFGAHFAAQRFPLPEPGPLVSTERATEILPTTATLKATLDPENKETTYRFKYGTDESYGRLTPTGTLVAGFYDETVEASLSGLTPSTTYHFRLVAEDSEGRTTEGPGRTFTTLPAVQIENESATDVSATAATFNADLDPLGAAADWWVEYGSAEGYGSATARGSLPSGFGAVPVSVRVTGLLPGTTYHYRFAAQDEREGAVYTVHGEDRTLTTQPGASPFGLSDGRAWEMVTPPAKSGRVVPLGELGDVQAATGGGAFAYLTAPLSEEAQGSSATDQVLAVREPSLGWRSHDLATPLDKVIGVFAGNIYPYRFFSPDLSQAMVEQVPSDETLLSDEASERTPYLRRTLCDASSSGCYTPLVTGKEGYANVPPGTEFAGAVKFVGATTDMQHVVLDSSVALTSDPAPGGGLYEWSAATRSLQLVSILPGGGAAASPDLGTRNNENVRHAISSDGSRVVFTSASHLYLRDVTRDETVQLDAVQGGIGLGSASAVFRTASVDGSRIFFTSGQKLTPDSGTAGSTGPDLYVCELAPDEATGALACSLSDLTPRTGAGEAAAVRGVLPGASEDGSRVYFVANGVLVPGAVSGSCGSEGSNPTELCNLYVARFAGGEWQAPGLVAVLSTEDRNDWAGELEGPLRRLTARVSPNGRWLAFMSNRPLTRYDNRDAASGERDEEVYLYDAAADRLLCASCNPSGARPHGAKIPLETSGERESVVDAQRNWTGRWLAAAVPGWTHASGNNHLHQPRYLSNSGRLFFNSADALASQDANGTWDVYEFEPAAVGDCTESAPTYSALNGGCVALVSSGRSAHESAFMDASESGDDVFFLTHAKLAPQDADTAADVYDAHVCSATSPCLPPPRTAAPCADSSSCQGAVIPAPAAASPGTASFAGRGNLQPIRHHHRGKHHRKRHKKAHHKRRHERAANHNRRAGR